MQSTLNRQLKQSLDVATRPPEQRDQGFIDYLEERKNTEIRPKQQRIVQYEEDTAESEEINGKIHISLSD